MRLVAAIPLTDCDGCEHMVRCMPLLAAIPANRFASVSYLLGFGLALAPGSGIKVSAGFLINLREGHHNLIGCAAQGGGQTAEIG